MRFTIAYYLLLLYVLVVIKPLIPFIHNAWSHEFDEIEHISLVHAKYGSHHLEKELAENSSDNDKNSNQTGLGSNELATFHLIIKEYRHNWVLNKHRGPHLLFKPTRLPAIFILPQGQPPEFS